MGGAIPPEWTVSLLALGKEPWRFKDLEYQLNMYRQHWQVDQQKHIIARMAGKMPSKSNDGIRKRSDRNHNNLRVMRRQNRFVQPNLNLNLNFCCMDPPLVVVNTP
jgi:hypothetical protein